MALLLSINGLTKHFGGLAAVNEFSHEFPKGKVTGLIGPNGAGKTTLFNLIIGFYKPSSGSIDFKGQDITGRSPHEICKMGIVKSYQNPQPFKNVRVFQNVLAASYFGAGLSGDEAEERTLKWLDFVNLLEKKDKFPIDLGLMDQKRLELAKSLATNPELLLLDESASGLSDEEIPDLLEIIRGINKMGITIIIVEHVLKVIYKVTDKTIVMHEGTKIAEGKAEKVIENPKVMEAYFG